MGNIPLDLERRCEKRWAARFSAARTLQEQHRLEGQQQRQQLTTPDNSKSKTRCVASAGLAPAPIRRAGTKDAMKKGILGANGVLRRAYPERAYPEGGSDAHSGLGDFGDRDGLNKAGGSSDV
jgi:hypothetical protein